MGKAAVHTLVLIKELKSFIEIHAPIQKLKSPVLYDIAYGYFNW